MILALANDPRPPGGLTLAGTRDLSRIGVRIEGTHWRVVYQLHARQRQVVVTRVVRRDEGTYWRLPR